LPMRPTPVPSVPDSSLMATSFICTCHGSGLAYVADGQRQVVTFEPSPRVHEDHVRSLAFVLALAAPPAVTQGMTTFGQDLMSDNG
jgi:hypothetical protein